MKLKVTAQPSGLATRNFIGPATVDSPNCVTQEKEDHGYPAVALRLRIEKFGGSTEVQLCARPAQQLSSCVVAFCLGVVVAKELRSRGQISGRILNFRKTVEKLSSKASGLKSRGQWRQRVDSPANRLGPRQVGETGKLKR